MYFIYFIGGILIIKKSNNLVHQIENPQHFSRRGFCNHILFVFQSRLRSSQSGFSTGDYIVESVGKVFLGHFCEIRVQQKQ